MKKSVLASIKPKYCELIASGKKTVEIRKNRPKIDVPFKCYIYCTLTGTNELPMDTYFNGKWHKRKGKVIGEFVCNEINVALLYAGKYPILCKDILNKSCLSMNEIEKYGSGKSCYAWHISDLVIYDKPKDLDWFRKPIECHREEQRNHCKGCWDCEIQRPPQSWCYVEEIEK